LLFPTLMKAGARRWSNDLFTQSKIWSYDGRRASSATRLRQVSGKSGKPVMARITTVLPFLRPQDACAISASVTPDRHSDVAADRRRKLAGNSSLATSARKTSESIWRGASDVALMNSRHKRPKVADRTDLPPCLVLRSCRVQV
jgi:hypothetical protein